MLKNVVRHPAKFSDSILEKIEDILEYCGRPEYVIDPFAGTGKVHNLNVTRTVGIELEPEWANLHPNTMVGNALELPFADRTFDAMITSPAFGNRLADHHNAQDGSRRHSYTHDIGRTLHPDNSGQLQWGQAYMTFHQRAWTECLRVLQPNALIVLNVSNHIRKGEEQPVAEWHMNWFMDHGCRVEQIDAVATPRLRDGQNAQARAKFEYVFALRYTPEEASDDDETVENEAGERAISQQRPGLADVDDPDDGGCST